MDKTLRDKLRKVEVDEDAVVQLFKDGKMIWEVAEKVYGQAFDHSDRETWIFYSKVNRIRKKHNLPRNVPEVPEPEVTKDA